jgi:hypothetical protein
LLDKLGSILKKEEPKKTKGYEDLLSKLNCFIDVLDKEIESNKTIPGYIKFKVINLIEKKKSGWTASLIEERTQAKGINDVRLEIEKQKSNNEEESDSTGGNSNQSQKNNFSTSSNKNASYDLNLTKTISKEIDFEEKISKLDEDSVSFKF